MNDKQLITQNNVEMLHTLRNTVAPGLTDSEFALFAEIVKSTGLNPVTKEVWAIKAGGRLQLMTGINGFLRIANSHPMFDGMEVEFDKDGDRIVAATAKVYRKDRRFPAVATAFMAEYGKPTPIWKQMPSVMLAKCAKSLAIREAFVQELGGLYTQEEMPAEFAPPRATTIPQEALIVSEKTGKVIGTKVEAKVEPVEDIVDVETGEILVEEDDLPDSMQVKPKAKKSKATTTYYNLETLQGDKLVIAETYLVANNAKRLTETHWKSPIRLEKLTTCIDEAFNE
jgi:phage recombination protein Bet